MFFFCCGVGGDTERVAERCTGVRAAFYFVRFLASAASVSLPFSPGYREFGHRISIFYRTVWDFLFRLSGLLGEPGERGPGDYCTRLHRIVGHSQALGDNCQKQNFLENGRDADQRIGEVCPHSSGARGALRVHIGIRVSGTAVNDFTRRFFFRYIFSVCFQRLCRYCKTQVTFSSSMWPKLLRIGGGGG